MKKTIKILSIVLLISTLLAFPTSASQKGDIDGDGKITASDARIILRYSVGLEYNLNRSVCDLDSDGKITASDARSVLRISVGLSYDGRETEYDILTSGTAAVSITLEGQTIKMTFCPEAVSLSMNAEEESMGIGLLLFDEEAYIIADRHDKDDKIALKTTCTEIDTMFANEGDSEIKLSVYTKKLANIFRNLPLRSEASTVTYRKINGQKCEVLKFYKNGKTTEAVLCGNKLIEITISDLGRIFFSDISSELTPWQHGDLTGYEIG